MIKHFCLNTNNKTVYVYIILRPFWCFTPAVFVGKGKGNDIILRIVLQRGGAFTHCGLLEISGVLGNPMQPSTGILDGWNSEKKLLQSTSHLQSFFS